MTSPFNERAALDELERFRQDIERERQRRRAVSDEFEAFIRSIRKPAEPTPPAATPAPPAMTLPPVPPRAEAPRPIAPPPPPRTAAPPPIDFPSETPLPPARSSVSREFDAPAAVDARQPPRRRSGVALSLLAVLIAGAALAWMFRPTTPPSSPATITGSPPAATTPPSAGAPPADAPAQSPATPPVAGEPASTPAAAPASTELTTSRNVWVRIIVDGERILERELPAGSRIPLTPQKTIVIRTGDAGAVRLTIAGEEQGSLGREGQVVTRTFTLPDR